MTDSARLGADAEPRHRYRVYGIGLESDAPLAMPRHAHDAICHVECRRAPASVFLEATAHTTLNARSDAWHRYAALRDGSTYVAWSTVGEFLVSGDGRRILCRPADGASLESFQVYLLGQALSFALVRQAFEPLHATVVVVGDRAIAFLGGNAFGKSTLAACFLEAGHRLLTDDVLIVEETADGLLAYPGPPRIKLFPRIAGRFLDLTVDGVEMNPDTDKLIVPLDDRRSCASPTPLHAIYTLAEPREACRQPCVRIEPLSPREAFVELVKSALNRQLADRARLTRQFDIMTRLADRLAIKKLVYPRRLSRLTEVRDAVITDRALADIALADVVRDVRTNHPTGIETTLE